MQKLVDKGLVEKYHSSGNRKDIILMVSPLGVKEYREYAAFAEKQWFHELFTLLDGVSPGELETVKKVFSIFGRWHGEKRASGAAQSTDLIRIE